MNKIRQYFASGLFLLIAFAILHGDIVFAAKPDADIKVGALTNGSHAVPTKQILHPPGKSLKFRGRSVDLAIAPGGDLIYVKNLQDLLVVDAANWTIIQSTNFPRSASSMHGIAVTKNGAHVYVTGAANELYDYSADSHRKLSFARTINLFTNSDPCGIALSADEKLAYVCLGRSNSLGVIDLAAGSVIKQIKVGIAPWGVALSPDGTTAFVSDWGGRYPVSGDPTIMSAGTPVVVDKRGIAASGVVSIVDLPHETETIEILTGLHPSDLVLSPDGKWLYVANANSDTVSVIDTIEKNVHETILMRPEASLPFGSASDALCLSPDGKTLFVANGGNNTIGVVDLPDKIHTNSTVRGFIPTDWYPGAIKIDRQNIFVANVKGYGSMNGDIYLLTGSMDKIPVPGAAALALLTKEARENSRVPEMLQSQVPAQSDCVPTPVPMHVGEPSVFKHVLYIIKENKTYDQVLGDIPSGNGSAGLCIYPKLVTPNHHSLATEYVLLDNYYCNGVYSTDGHSWCTEANATDYWEKNLGTINRAGHQGDDPLMFSSSGFIWNNVLQHGLTFYNYGVMGLSTVRAQSYTWLQVYADYTSHSNNYKFNTYIACPPVLPVYSSTNVSGFNLKIPDQCRADGFLREFDHAVVSNSWPAFNMFYLPDDHTAGGSPGYPTPRAEVADNDLALGRVVEAITKSSFGSNTVIFVIEDDPQSGTDHVDAHRSLCLVISPYTKRHQTVSTFYNQIGLIHTMEQILGIPPMNQMDAMGPLMSDCFTNHPDFRPYTTLTNNIALDEMNPGTTGALRRDERYWAEESLKMDFSKPDLVNDDMLNRIIWHSIKGNQRYPMEFAGPHGKGLKKLGLISAKSGKTDDDD